MDLRDFSGHIENHAKYDRYFSVLLINCFTQMRTLSIDGSNYAFAAGGHIICGHNVLQVRFF